MRSLIIVVPPIVSSFDDNSCRTRLLTFSGVLVTVPAEIRVNFSIAGQTHSRFAQTTRTQLVVGVGRVRPWLVNDHFLDVSRLGRNAIDILPLRADRSEIQFGLVALAVRRRCLTIQIEISINGKSQKVTDGKENEK